MKTRLFFAYPTCVDHAYIDNQGLIIGGSYHPIIEVIGEVDEHESVVIDFSSGKKRMKQIIDEADGRIGFDHKLWIIPGLSACQIQNLSDTHYRIETACGNEIILPKTDVHIVQRNFDRTVQITMAAEMADVLKREMPEFDFEVKLTEVPFTTSTDDEPLTALFRYAHGLKDSTSYGCKNIAHGHLSFFEITERRNDYREECEDCQLGNKLIKDGMRNLNNIVFINKANIISEDDNLIHIGYDTPRGRMDMTVNKNVQPYAVLDTESTIEYLAEFIFKRFANAMLLAKVKAFRVSEGLQKGVTFRVAEQWDNIIF